ncbi:MAG: DUF2190 family protein [Gammaproteobacteria bacterium]|nr:DUF2190 family protein [Gammaproteobacteria bacterium]MBU2685783.1 DUF2190 family protein [Gammaproteobacteria bacterium]
MSQYGKYEAWGFRADSDLSSYQYHFVQAASTAEYVALASTGSTTVPVGVLMNDPDTQGDPAEVALRGIVKVQADGTSAITYGAFLTFNTEGHAVVATIGSTASTTRVMGRAMQAVASGSAVIKVHLFDGPRILGGTE